MKTYIFGHPSGALFVSDKGRRIELNKGDRFEIGRKGEQYYVVRDGKGVRITDAEKRSLIRNSEQLKPGQNYLDRIAYLYAQRKNIQENCLRYLEGLESKGVSEIVPFYERNSVGAVAKCFYGVILLAVSTNVVGVSLYCKDDKRLQAALKSDLASAIRRRADRLANTLDDAFIDNFRSLSMHMGNITIPVQGKFSGRCYSYNANWTLED